MISSPKLVRLLVLTSLLFTGMVFAYLPDKAAIGYPYSFNASLGGALKNTPCLLTADDKFGTNVKSWRIDGDGWPLQTDASGYLHTYIIPDNSFVLGENYTFALSCASNRQSRAVLFEVGGSSVQNIFTLNALEYWNANPQEALLAGIVIVVLLSVIAIVARAVYGRRTIW